jgi:hypothetical protein
MIGPKIIGMANPQDGSTPTLPRETGIRKRGGVWIAVKDGRMVDSFTGPGCKAAAIQAAGTNRVLS